MAVRPASFANRLHDALHGRSLPLAGVFLALCAAGQLCALASYVVGGGVSHARAATLATLGPAPSPTVSGPGPVSREILAALAPPAPTPAIPAAPLPPPAVNAAAPVVPTPVPPGAVRADPGSSLAANLPPTQSLVVPGRGSAGAGAVAEMVEQAKALRSRGDTQSALARLRDAQNLVGSGENGPVIAEMALTYEQMGFADRATQQWQRLYELGDAAGAPYYLAESRLRGIGHAQEVPGGLVGNLGPGETADPTGSGRDGNGFQLNALLRILEVKVEEDPSDPEAERKLSLRTVIKNRPGSYIDPRKVRVEAQFYDLVAGSNIVPTDAETGFQWLTPPVDWVNDASEILEATYRRLRGTSGTYALLPPPSRGPIPGRPAPVRREGRSGGGRKSAPPAAAPPEETKVSHAYLGYMVRLYYKGQLQDVKADPAQLFEQFHPALTLPVEASGAP